MGLYPSMAYLLGNISESNAGNSFKGLFKINSFAGFDCPEIYLLDEWHKLVLHVNKNFVHLQFHI